MVINSFEISQDKSNLVLSLSDAVTATTLKLWTQTTYKTDGLEIDLSDRLDGTSDPIINIPYTDLNIDNFDGVYFIEVGDGTTTICRMVAELTRYKECVLSKVLEAIKCDSCTEIKDMSVYTAQILLLEVIDAIELGAKQETLVLIFALDKICDNKCDSCGEYKLI